MSSGKRVGIQIENKDNMKPNEIICPSKIREVAFENFNLSYLTLEKTGTETLSNVALVKLIIFSRRFANAQ
jgi:hypothetical protein